LSCVSLEVTVRFRYRDLSMKRSPSSTPAPQRAGTPGRTSIVGGGGGVFWFFFGFFVNVVGLLRFERAGRRPSRRAFEQGERVVAGSAERWRSPGRGDAADASSSTHGLSRHRAPRWARPRCRGHSGWPHAGVDSCPDRLARRVPPAGEFALIAGVILSRGLAVQIWGVRRARPFTPGKNVESTCSSARHPSFAFGCTLCYLSLAVPAANPPGGPPSV